MILQRISKALRQQDWFTVVIETLIVVFGVFMGLQVNNWNSQRINAAEERVMLVRLQSDFKAVLNDSDEKIIFLQEVQPMNAALLQLIRDSAKDTDNDASKETYAKLLSKAFSLPRTPGMSDTYEELVTSGKMNLVSNQALRVALTSMATEAREIAHAQQAVREWSRPYIIPLVRLRTLVEEYPVEEAITLAGERSDLLVAIRMYEEIFSGQLEYFEYFRRETLAVIELLKTELETR